MTEGVAGVLRGVWYLHYTLLYFGVRRKRKTEGQECVRGLGHGWSKVTKGLGRMLRGFNEVLKDIEGLQANLLRFRSWYYVPELDAVAPSKFIGFADMTGEFYEANRKGSLNGGLTEPRLGQVVPGRRSRTRRSTRRSSTWCGRCWRTAARS